MTDANREQPTQYQTEPPPGDDKAVDLSFLIECFGDDEETHREILQEFAGSATSNVDNIMAAQASGDADNLVSQAHSFKSAARTVGANKVADICQGLETAGKVGDWDTINQLAPNLPPEMAKVSAFIAAF